MKFNYKIRTLFLIFIVFIISGQNRNIEDIIKEEEQKLQEIKEQDNQYFQEIEEEYRHYEEAVTKEYQAAEQKYREELEEMKRKILEKWDELELKTNKQYVEYDENLDSRGKVDFEEGVVEVEAIAEEGAPDSEEEAREKVKDKVKSLLKKEATDAEPLLKDQITNEKGVKIDEKNVDQFIKSEVEENIFKDKAYEARDGKKRVKYVVKIPMVPDHIEVRAQRYRSEVLKQAKEFNVDPALVMAIIHTESSFNPQAKSYIPAYGLMQLVPRTGARDAYNYIYNRDRYISSNYLYDPKNNIKLGCGYIAKLRYVYFKNITNDENAFFCVISSYNGGVGTVAKTISGSTNLNSIIRIVNSHDPNWTYSTLEQKLPYKETRNYLKKVTARHRMYDNWLSS